MTDLHKLGFAQFEEQFTGDDMPARVSSVHPRRCSIWTEHGVRSAVVAGHLLHQGAHPVVGDWVGCSVDGDTAVIEKLAPRKTLLARNAAGRSSAEQPIAANVDKVLIVTTPGEDFSVPRVERYLAITWESGAEPIVVINKIETIDDPTPLLAALRSSTTGVPVVFTSAVHGLGIEELMDATPEGSTLVLAGSSGVGKSTLLNRLLGNAVQTTQAVRASVEKGRHTTTTRSLWLTRGRVVIDTPGVRELGLPALGAGLSTAFADIETLATRCRFRDCSHQTEPGCAVVAAAQDGELPEQRLRSYLELDAEQLAAARRADAQAQKAEGRKMGKMIREANAWRRMRRNQ